MLIVVGVEVFRKVTVLLVSMMILTMIVVMGMVLTVLVLMVPGSVLVPPRATDPPGRVLGEGDPVIIVRNTGEYSRQSRLNKKSGEEGAEEDNGNVSNVLSIISPCSSPPRWTPGL